MIWNGEILLRPFDTVVQRGTEHAWTNRSGREAMFAVVTVDLSVAGLAQPERWQALELSALYGLTPAETELALAMAAGTRLSAFARSRSVSINTVRRMRRAFVPSSARRARRKSYASS